MFIHHQEKSGKQRWGGLERERGWDHLVSHSRLFGNKQTAPFPKSCSALCMARGSGTECAQRGGCWCQALCFPGLGKELWLCQTEQGAWNGQTRPGHVQGASQAARKVKFRCVWIRIWTSLSCSCASQGLLMGSVRSEVLWEQTDGQCPVGPDVKKVPETCHHICLSPQITLSPQVLGSPGDLLQ